MVNTATPPYGSDDTVLRQDRREEPLQAQRNDFGAFPDHRQVRHITVYLGGDHAANARVAVVLEPASPVTQDPSQGPHLTYPHRTRNSRSPFHPDILASPAPESLPLALRVKVFMENETERGLNIEQISGIFNVSRSTLFLHFKQTFGKSPVEVLIDVRLQRARRLLEKTTLSMGEVASEAGYSDPLYFSRQFTRHIGQSPTTYRSTHRA